MEFQKLCETQKKYESQLVEATHSLQSVINQMDFCKKEGNPIGNLQKDSINLRRKIAEIEKILKAVSEDKEKLLKK